MNTLFIISIAIAICYFGWWCYVEYELHNQCNPPLDPPTTDEKNTFKVENTKDNI